uniref:Uncharacterized protein n=1 Tax=Anguilla anguilla TaxID=7936 RepID=A0A0E9XJJ5_ANGAN
MNHNTNTVTSDSSLHSPLYVQNCIVLYSASILSHITTKLLNFQKQSAVPFRNTMAASRS